MVCCRPQILNSGTTEVVINFCTEAEEPEFCLQRAAPSDYQLLTVTLTSAFTDAAVVAGASFDPNPN